MNENSAKKTVATGKLTLRMRPAEGIPFPETGNGRDAGAPALNGGATVQAVPVDDLDPNPFQPRADFEEETLDELAASFREHGQLQPIVVAETGGGRLVIVCGERRVQAAKRLGWRTLEARVYPGVTEQELQVIALVENVQRENLSPLEVATGFARFVSAGGRLDELARLTGLREITVRRYLKITALSPEVLAASKIANIGFKKLYELAASGLSPTEQLNIIRIWSTGTQLSAAEARRKVFPVRPSRKKSPSRTNGDAPVEMESGHFGGKTTWFTSTEASDGKSIPLTVMVRARRKALPAVAFRAGLARVIQQSYGEDVDLVAALRRAAEEIEASRSAGG